MKPDTKAFSSRPFSLSTLILFLLLPTMNSPVFADPNAFKPFTASELPIMATTPNLINGVYGPQVKLDAPTLDNIPEPLYLDKSLEAGIKETGSVQIKQISIEYNPLISEKNHRLQNTTLDQPQALTQEKIDSLKSTYLKECQDTGYVCDATVSIKNDVLNIALTPLTLEGVEIEGVDRWQKRVLRHYLHKLSVQAEDHQPLRLGDLQRQLRLAQINPDLSFTSDLEVLPYTHQAKLKINTTEHKTPFHLVASWNNLDQIIFGRGFTAITGVANNVTGNGDSLMSSVVFGYRSTGTFTRYEYPITPSFRAFAEYQFAKINPYDPHYNASGSHGYAYKFSPGLKYIFWDRPNSRASMDVAFDLKQGITRSEGDPIEREAIRAFRGGINYDQKLGKTTLSTRHEFAEAVPIWSGSLASDKRLSWYRGGSQYFRYTGYATLSRPMPMDSTASVNFQWQFSPNGVSNFDVGGIGGAFYVRGYREVYIFCDSYAMVNLQWQFPAKFIPKKVRLPFADKPLRDTTQIVSFVDYGYGGISHAPRGVDASENLVSTGMGIRSQLNNRTTVRFDVGAPLARELPFSQGARFHIGTDVALF